MQLSSNPLLVGMVNSGIFLPYQARWILSDAPYKDHLKSRRIGISYAEAARSVAIAATPKRQGGISTSYMGLEKDMTKQFIEDCDYWAGVLNQSFVHQEDKEASEFYEAQVFSLRFPSTGHTIKALPSKASAFRSRGGRVVIDEGGFIDELKEILAAAQPLMVWGAGAQISVISSASFVAHHFHTNLLGNEKYEHHRVTIEDALSEGLYRHICGINKTAWSEEIEEAWLKDLIETSENPAREYYCQPDLEQVNALFKVSDFTYAEGCGNLVLDYRGAQSGNSQTDQDAAAEIERLTDACLTALEGRDVLYWGMDYGRSETASTLLFAGDKEGGGLQSELVIELYTTPADAQISIVQAILDAHPEIKRGSFDCTGSGINAYDGFSHRYKVNIEAVGINKDWYKTIMADYHEQICAANFLAPTHECTYKDHSLVKVTLDQPSMPPDIYKWKKRVRHGELAIAGALCWQSYLVAVDKVIGVEDLAAPIVVADTENPQRRDGYGRPIYNEDV